MTLGLAGLLVSVAVAVRQNRQAHAANQLPAAIIDRRMALLPLNYRLPRTWQAAKPFIDNERAKRAGNGVTVYLRAFEHLAQQFNHVDIPRMASKLFRSRRRDRLRAALVRYLRRRP
jgi:hypothetical protein